MTKQNFDAKRAAALHAMHVARVKAAEKAKKEVAKQANAQPVVDDTAVIQAAADKLITESAVELIKQVA